MLKSVFHICHVIKKNRLAPAPRLHTESSTFIFLFVAKKQDRDETDAAVLLSALSSTEKITLSPHWTHVGCCVSPVIAAT